ncbi:MAG: GTPase domain-containing protein, partial [Vicinamibacteria bacterium]|nr:GTPase domain-containing protein [Vicinamibacteria bacterium]
MALLSSSGDELVLRIVYDGPAMSGKTTTLRSLARSLGRNMFSGDEAEGRTLYFDWVDYTGGRFDGRPIRCQLVSVPGQRALRARRERIIETADAVVFVADTRMEKLPADVRMALSLQSVLARAETPRPGIVIQANKRDAPDAAPLADVRTEFERLGEDVAVMESIASEGVGVRETFIFAVRLALDRVREHVRLGRLQDGPVEIESGEALLAAIRVAEASEGIARNEPSAPLGSHEPPPAGVEFWRPPHAPTLVRDLPAPCASAPRPLLPTVDVPSGLIWPPIGGRVALQRALDEPLEATLFEDGSWSAVSGAWRARSEPEDVFDELQDGRAALLDWARLHSEWSGFLSSNRCVVLAATGEGRWRLWQVVGAARSIRSELSDLVRVNPAAFPRALLRMTEVLKTAFDRSLGEGFALSIDTLSAGDAGPRYVGLAPSRSCRPAASGPPDFEELVRREFGPFVASAVASSPVDVPRALVEISQASRGSRIGEILAVLLIG